MKKRNIIIGIVIFLLVIISIGIIAVNKTYFASISHDLKAYMYTPVSVVDNKIDVGDRYIIPFIFESTEDRLDLEGLKKQFEIAELTIDSVSSDKLGTGTIIQTVEDTKPYEILIYGDVDGDGRIGLSDAQRIIRYVLDPDTNGLLETYYIAANVCNSDDEVNTDDSERIIDFCIQDVDTILAELPEEDLIVAIEVYNPTKVVYDFGEDIDLTGAKVRRITANGTRCSLEDLPKNSPISGYDKENYDEDGQEVTVTYLGQEGTIRVKVLKPVSTLYITNDSKAGDTSVGKQFVIGTVKQGEGESHIDITKLKTSVIDNETGEETDAVTISYLRRSEVFNDSTDENKDDIVIVGVANKEGSYTITTYIGEDLEDASATSNTVVLDITNNVSVDTIEVSNSIVIVCKDNLDGVDTSSTKFKETTVTVAGQEEKYYYTLVPVKFKDQYGNYQPLEAESFIGYSKSENGKIAITDNCGFEIPGFDVKTFREDANGNIINAGGENEFTYIGFAPLHNVDASLINGKTITITYGPRNLNQRVYAEIQVRVVE